MFNSCVYWLQFGISYFLCYRLNLELIFTVFTSLVALSFVPVALSSGVCLAFHFLLFPYPSPFLIACPALIGLTCVLLSFPSLFATSWWCMPSNQQNFFMYSLFASSVLDFYILNMPVPFLDLFATLWTDPLVLTFVWRSWWPVLREMIRCCGFTFWELSCHPSSYTLNDLSAKHEAPTSCHLAYHRKA